jgi:hypothetical protein
MFVDIIFALFVIAAVGYFFYYFVLPRPSTILKELAGNRLRIEFVSPPIPSTPLQTVWFNILGLLDREGYGQSLETALRELGQLFTADPDSVREFLALKDEEALTKFLKFIGCTAFELSKKKRVEQDLKNLDAVLACVRTIITTEEGKQAVADVKDALYDVYHATFYSPAATQAVAFAILRDMLHHSEKAYKEIVESMEDLMYNPIKEEFLLAQLFERLANTDSVPLLTAAVSFVDALLKSPHAGEYSTMFRHHFEERGVQEKLQVCFCVLFRVSCFVFPQSSAAHDVASFCRPSVASTARCRRPLTPWSPISPRATRPSPRSTPLPMIR